MAHDPWAQLLGQLPADAKRLLAHHGAAELPLLPTPTPQSMAVLLQVLRSSTASPGHQVWSDDISVLDAARFRHEHMHGQRQLTDIYLLGLTVKNSGRFVSSDARISFSAVLGATAQQPTTTNRFGQDDSPRHATHPAQIVAVKQQVLPADTSNLLSWAIKSQTDIIVRR